MDSRARDFLRRSTPIPLRRLRGILLRRLALLTRTPRILRALERVARTTVLMTEYPASPEPRWGWNRPPHAELDELLGSHADEYRLILEALEGRLPYFRAIRSVVDDPDKGFWDNEFFGNLDGLALYALIAERQPSRIVEIGSGYSTRLARRAIGDLQLGTKLVSIDPYPRVTVDGLCDDVYRVGLQEAPRAVLDELEAGDLLLIDGSHMAYMNSDATIFFTEVLGRLSPNVLVGLDDIFLPWDYPPTWTRRWYSEQYLLAVLLLSQASSWQVRFPAWWVSHDPGASDILDRLERALPTHVGLRGGTTFWMDRA